MADTDPIIFIASTCYDLADIRAELRADLEKDGFVVKLSEDPDSAFCVEPTINSIETCLENVRSSRTVLLILDRRYGPELGGRYGEKSATHVEFETAVDKDLGVFTFIREQTHMEWEQWRRNPEGFKSIWVEGDSYRRLFEFINHVRDLHNRQERSNWVDPFKNSVELRRIALTRLYSRHKAYANARAKTRERIVRLTFGNVKVEGVSADHAKLRIGSLRNAGLNVAEGVELFLMDGSQRVAEAYAVAGKRVQTPCYFEVLALEEAKKDIQFSIPVRNAGGKPEYRYQDLRIVCEYRNLWQDKYLVWAPLHKTNSSPPYSKGREELEVVITD